MKKILIYLFTASLFLHLVGCESFLDRNPHSSLSVETYWQSEQDLSTWNAGMYDGLQSTLGNNWLYWGELRSGVYAERGTASNRNLLYNGLNSQTISTAWNSLYSVIYRANAAIKHIPSAPIGSTVAAPYLAQAHTMRAMMYFYAIRVWGDVPKICEPLEDVLSQERYYKRTSVKELKDFILSDLESATSYYGSDMNMSGFSKYYLNRGTALALKIDVLMWYKEYDKALPLIGDLINNYGYELEPTTSYSSMFKNPDTSKEMIFNLFWNYEQDGRGFGYAQELASGSHTIRYHPNNQMFENLILKKQDDLRVNLVMDTFAISQFIAPDEIVVESYDKAYADDYGNPASFQIKCPKFVEYSATATKEGYPGYLYDTNAQCATRMPIYRISDFILLKAEALVLGSTKNYQGAIDIVNQIRKRAGWNQEATLNEFSTEKDLIKLIIDERTIEFWAEGKRWFDLVRNDMVKEYLDPFMKDERIGEFGNPLGFEIGAEKPSADHIGGYGRILWPLNQEVFRKNPMMSGNQNLPYEE